MANCLITLRSSTYSLKAQKLFEEKGIASRAVKLDGDYLGRGCTHGIRIDCRHTGSARRLLSEYGIPYSDIKTI